MTSQLSDSHNDMAIIAGFFLSTFIPGGGGTPRKWPIRGSGFQEPRLHQVYERLEILLVEVYERLGKSVILARKKA